MTRTIDFNIEPHRSARWTVAALVNDRVVAFEQFDTASAADLTKDQVWEAKRRLADASELVAAHEAFEATLPEDMEERLAVLSEMDDDDIVDTRVVFGMVSGGRFTFDMSKGDLARAGAKHLA